MTQARMRPADEIQFGGGVTAAKAAASRRTPKRGAESENYAFWGDRGEVFGRRGIPAGRRGDVWGGAETALGEEIAAGREEPHTHAGECAAGARSGKDNCGRDGEWNEMGCQTARDLRSGRGRSTDRGAGEGGSAAR